MSKQKFEVEIPIRSSVELLYPYLKSASGLQDWFAEEVRIERKNFIVFGWSGDEQKAEILQAKPNQLVRFRWVEAPEEEYFQFELLEDALTGDVSLVITDFEEEDEIEDAKQVYGSAVDQLKQVVGG